MAVAAHQNIIKPGYKQTEVGVIPEGWNLCDLNVVASVIDGDRGTHYPSTDEFSDSGHCLFLNAGNVTNDGFKFVDCAFITQEKDALLNKGKLKRNDIVLTTRGTVGNLAYFDAAVPFENIRINSGMVILRNTSLLLDTAFLYDVLRSRLVQKQIERLSFGSAQPQLTVRGISSFGIVVPPIPEQRAITKALNDVNALITALEELIAKKCDLKKAAMQQLLTGKQRLPGFDGEWEVKRLGDVARVKTGKKNNEDKCEDGAYPFFVRSQTVQRINTYSFDGEAILVPGEGGIGSIFHYIEGKFDVHQRVYKISDFNKKTYGKFIYFCMIQTFNKQAMRNSVKATVDSLRLPTFLEFEFLAPAFQEQTAIAAVLTDMDAEIAALEQRLDKTRAVKQGTMQELLTGKTRLI